MFVFIKFNLFPLPKLHKNGPNGRMGANRQQNGHLRPTETRKESTSYNSDEIGANASQGRINYETRPTNCEIEPP